MVSLIYYCIGWVIKEEENLYDQDKQVHIYLVMYNWCTKITQTLCVNVIEAAIDTIKVDCTHSVKETALIFLFNLNKILNQQLWIHSYITTHCNSQFNKVTYFWVSDV